MVRKTIAELTDCPIMVKETIAELFAYPFAAIRLLLTSLCSSLQSCLSHWGVGVVICLVISAEVLFSSVFAAWQAPVSALVTCQGSCLAQASLVCPAGSSPFLSWLTALPALP